MRFAAGAVKAASRAARAEQASAKRENAGVAGSAQLSSALLALRASHRGFRPSNDKIKIGGSSYKFLTGDDAGVRGDWKAAKRYSVADGTRLDIEWMTDQFYVSKMDVSAVPEPASSALLTGVGLFGLALLRRRLNGDLS